MQELTEDIENLGPFYKKKFEELSDLPESEVKDELFAKMDILEGKRPKTIYLHINLFGLKVAASISMIIVSSLAFVAVAAVTAIAIKNNQDIKNQELLPSTKKEPLVPSSQEVQLPEKSKEVIKKTESTSKVNQQEHVLQEKQVQEKEETLPEKKDTEPLNPSNKLEKNGDNSKLLKEIDDEEDLFGK